MIGIVGGIGPLAGIDLYRQILENTDARTDQEHVPVMLASVSHEIADRTEFLLRKSTENPAYALANVVTLLEQAGARTIGLACNTAHAPEIMDVVSQLLTARGSAVEIVNMIDETVRTIQANSTGTQRIGVLCTSGTYQARLYQDKLETSGFEVALLPFERHDAIVQDAIFNPGYGLKSLAAPSQQSLHQLNAAIEELKNLGAQAIILGCTEIGMVEQKLGFQGLNLEIYNPNTILARALLARAYPEKLMPPTSPTK
jgi:aspartate racemase